MKGKEEKYFVYFNNFDDTTLVEFDTPEEASNLIVVKLRHPLVSFQIYSKQHNEDKICRQTVS